MKIIVCIKSVPASDCLSPREDVYTLNRETEELMMNPYDEYALEEALKIKDISNGNVTVLSMGLSKSKPVLQNALARGADRAILITDNRFAGSDTLATAYILAEAIRKINLYNLLIFGEKSSDSETAQIGPEVGGFLNISQITGASSLTITGRHIICSRETDYGHEIIKTQLPAVITVSNKSNYPRFPSVRSIKEAKKIPVEVWDAEDLKINTDKIGLKGSPTKVIGVETGFNHINPVMIKNNEIQKFEKMIIDEISLLCKKTN